MDYSIGTRIKELRKSLNITGKDIKEKTGISTGNLSDIEKGKVLPSSASLIELSKVLNCSTDYILFGKTRNTEFSPYSNLRDFEKDFLLLLNSLNEEDKEEIMDIMKLKYNRYKTKKKNEVKSSLSLQNSSNNIA